MTNQPHFISTKLPGGYVLGARSSLTPEQQRQVVALLEARSDRIPQVLHGRGNVLHTEVTGIGRVVVKRYRRGGLLRYLVRSAYLRWGPTRAEQEFLLP